MNNRMISTLAISLALASPAAAEQVKVSLIGKDEPTLRAEIHKAAVKACRTAYIGDRIAEFYYLQDCISDAEASGLQQARAALATGSSTAIASLSPAAPAPAR